MPRLALIFIGPSCTHFHINCVTYVTYTLYIYVYGNVPIQAHDHLFCFEISIQLFFSWFFYNNIIKRLCNACQLLCVEMPENELYKCMCIIKGSFLVFVCMCVYVCALNTWYTPYYYKILFFFPININMLRVVCTTCVCVYV